GPARTGPGRRPATVRAGSSGRRRGGHDRPGVDSWSQPLTWWGGTNHAIVRAADGGVKRPRRGAAGRAGRRAKRRVRPGGPRHTIPRALLGLPFGTYEAPLPTFGTPSLSRRAGRGAEIVGKKPSCRPGLLPQLVRQGIVKPDDGNLSFFAHRDSAGVWLDLMSPGLCPVHRLIRSMPQVLQARSR